MRLNHTGALRHVTSSGDQSRRRQRNNIVVDRSVDSANCMSPFMLLLLLLLLLVLPLLL